MTLKRILTLLLLAAAAFGAPNSGSITAAGAACVPTTCVWTTNAKGTTSDTIQISGTFAATLQFEASLDRLTWTSITGYSATGAAATSATTAGIWRFNVAGLPNLRVRASAFSSGPVKIDIASASTSGGSLGNGTTVIDPLIGIYTPSVTMPAGTPTLVSGACQATADVITPDTGDYSLFLDSGNSCHLTSMDSARATADLQAGGSGSGFVTPPVDASDTCTAGQSAANASWYFFCAATNTWVRAAMAPWGTVATPTFSPASPYSGAATTVTITDSTSGSAIQYCTDSDNTCDPTAGTSYSAPVSIAATGYLRAVGTKAALDNSAVASWQGTIPTIFTDSFSGSGGLGGNWQTIAAEDAMSKAGGVAGTATAYHRGAAYNSTSALGNDGYVQVDFNFNTNPVGSALGPIWRASSDGSFYYLNFAGTYVELYRSNAGGGNSYLDHLVASFATSNTTWYTAKVVYTGSTFDVYFGPQGGPLTLKGSMSDGSLTTGKPGMVVLNGDPSTYPVLANFAAQ